jgi:peptidoglycan hydrolase CwlO-like protein
MGLIFIMFSLNNNAKHNREIREKDRFLKEVQAEKERIQEELSRLKLEISGKVSDETKKENNSTSNPT